MDKKIKVQVPSTSSDYFIDVDQIIMNQDFISYTPVSSNNDFIFNINDNGYLYLIINQNSS